jgi:hypothetical protein
MSAGAGRDVQFAAAGHGVDGVERQIQHGPAKHAVIGQDTQRSRDIGLD